MPKSKDQWLDYITKLHPQTIQLGLERMGVIAQRFHLNQSKAKIITVTGTNGKGSCVRFLEKIYLAAGYKVGAYTSPHLLNFNERIRVNGEEVTDEALLDAFENIEAIRGGIALTFFEFTTLAALWIYQKTPLDVLIVEVGLGGRLDAVNILNADVAVITTIDLDHLDWLGPTRELIAKEKAGIMRSGKPLVIGDLNPPANLLELARQNQSPVYRINKQFSFEVRKSSWEWEGKKNSYQALPLLNLKYQNAAAALQVIELLQDVLPVTFVAIQKGLQNVTLPGRFEKLSKPFSIILDVAHNPESARWLAEQISKENKPQLTIAVVGMLKDKIIDNTLEPMLPWVDTWYLGGLEVERGGDASHLAAYFQAKKQKNWYNFPSVETALTASVKNHQDVASKRLVVFGSFYTVAAAKQFFSQLR